MPIIYRESDHFVWEVSKLLGKGSVGNVYQGQRKKTGELVAVKVLNPNALDRSKDLLNREVEVLKKLDHINIVRVFAVEKERSGLKVKGRIICMELCSGGSLASVLEDPENQYGLPELEFLNVLNHLGAGVKYLRESGIAHRDIKPHNILKCITEDGQSIYKLTDFDAARELREGEQFDSLYGTEEYLHPDMYDKAFMPHAVTTTRFSASTDLWSVGATLYHLATGRYPFRAFGARSNREVMSRMIREKEHGVISAHQINSPSGPIIYEKNLPLNCHLSPQLRELLAGLLGGLLEGDASKSMSYDQFFNWIEGLQKRKIVHIFYVNRIQELSFYLDLNEYKTLKDFQGLLFRETRVKPQDQILLYKNESLTSLMSEFRMDLDRLPLTSEFNPIILISLSSTSVKYEPTPRENWFETHPLTFINFQNRVDLREDVSLAKHNCGAGHEFAKKIEKYRRISKLFNLAMQNINIIVEQQLVNIERENNVICSRVGSINSKIDMMRAYSSSCSTFLDLLKQNETKFHRRVKRASKELAKIQHLFEASLFSDFTGLLTRCGQLKASIEHILSQQNIKNQKGLIVEWENEIAKLSKVTNFDLNAVRAGNLVKLLRGSHTFISNEEASFTKSEGGDEQIAYLMERLRMMNKCQEFDKLLKKDCAKGFSTLVELFSDWVKKAQVALIKPHLLMNEILELKGALCHCEEELAQIFQQYLDTMEAFTQSLGDGDVGEGGVNGIIKRGEIKDNSKRIVELKNQMLELNTSQMEIREEYSDTLTLFAEFENLLNDSLTASGYYSSSSLTDKS